MTRGKALAWGVAIAGVLAVAWYWQAHHDPAARVRRRFTELAALIAKTQPETAIQLAIKSQQLQGFFTNPAELRTPVYGLGGSLPPTDIASQTMVARAYLQTVDLQFKDCRVTMQGRDRATATVTARLLGKSNGNGAVDEIRELECALVREDRTWRFTSCTVVTVLEK